MIMNSFNKLLFISLFTQEENHQIPEVAWPPKFGKAKSLLIPAASSDADMN